jgi:NAD(P)-dependent dehydrogenase (short-subunit alcohol dehydrogenase family)
VAHRLRGKVAIVTGAGSGIGRVIAVLFAAEGARLVLCGRTPRTLAETAGLICGAGGECLEIPCDVSDGVAVESMVAQSAGRFGRIDVLVNNAAIPASAVTAAALSEAEWQRTMDVNAKGSWLPSKAVIPHMRRGGAGSIVMISSISAHLGQRAHGAYNAAKAAQGALMKCMALDFAPDGIRVNAVCPAWIATEMNREELRQMEADPQRIFPSGLSYADLLRLHPLGRIGRPEDVAWAALYLASDEAAWVTGASLFVDGGYTCQ